MKYGDGEENNIIVNIINSFIIFIWFCLIYGNPDIL